MRRMKLPELAERSRGPKSRSCDTGRGERVVEILSLRVGTKGGWARVVRFRLERKRQARPLGRFGVVLERHWRSGIAGFLRMRLGHRVLRWLLDRPVRPRGSDHRHASRTSHRSRYRQGGGQSGDSRRGRKDSGHRSKPRPSGRRRGHRSLTQRSANERPGQNREDSSRFRFLAAPDAALTKYTVARYTVLR